MGDITKEMVLNALYGDKPPVRIDTQLAVDMVTHGDMLSLAGSKGTIIQAISIFVTSEGDVLTRVTGFTSPVDLLGTLEMGVSGLKRDVLNGCG